MKKNSSNITDAEILKECVSGNRVYQEILYRKFAPKMYAVCLAYVKDRDLAKDVLQDGFIKVFGSLKKFSGEGSLEGWIRRIIVRTSIDYYRLQVRDQRLTSIDEIHSNFLEINTPDIILEKELLELIQKLPDGARIIFNLYIVEGYSHDEIAKLLDISTSTSKTQVHRARILLRQWIDKLYPFKNNPELVKHK